MTIGNHRRGLGEFIHLMPIEAWIEKCFSWSWRLHNLGITEALTDFGVRRPETHSYRGSGVCYVALIRIFVGKRMHCIIQRRFCVGREGGVLIGKPALAPKQQWFKCNARKGTPFPTSSLFVLLQCQEKDDTVGYTWMSVSVFLRRRMSTPCSTSCFPKKVSLQLSSEQSRWCLYCAVGPEESSTSEVKRLQNCRRNCWVFPAHASRSERHRNVQFPSNFALWQFPNSFFRSHHTEAFGVGKTSICVKCVGLDITVLHLDELFCRFSCGGTALAVP